MRNKRYLLASGTAESRVGTMVCAEGLHMRTRTGVFRQMDNGSLAPVAARHSRDEAQALIPSLEAFWPGPYILKDLPPLSSVPTE